MIENQTGLPMVMRQYGTADLDLWTPDPGRFARVLPPGSRAAVYWDDAELARELVVKPAPPGEEDDWHWSGECMGGQGTGGEGRPLSWLARR